MSNELVTFIVNNGVAIGVLVWALRNFNKTISDNTAAIIKLVENQTKLITKIEEISKAQNETLRTVERCKVVNR